ncbi:MAG: ChaN family lipoprotein [Planctomycetes bacterium]|nr:ChaN family lipoprotein [Planctomycetota bacterium]
MRPLAALVVLGLLLCACASAPKRTAPPDPRSPAVFRGGDGSSVAWTDFVAESAAADALVIGENHGHPLGLSCAAALFEDVLARSPQAALALEFIERDDQVVVDDYLAGLIDEAKFRERVGKPESSYPPGHRAMLEAAKAAGRPVRAGNAPRQYVRLARTDGYDRLRALTAEQQRLFRIPDEMIGGEYRADFDGLMSTPHEPGAESQPAEAPEQRQKRLDDVYRSQHLWDWTMADALAALHADGHRPVVQVVGRFHSDKRGGLVQALERLRPGVRVVTVSFVNERADALRDADRGRADFVIYVGPSSEPAD